MSVTSHPTSTPLGASTLPEDILNMNTPSGFLASMPPTGLTPLPASQGGLSLPTGMAGIPGLSEASASKDPAKERYERLKEVADILKTRTAGRGISKAHVQQLARIHGFDEALDEDNLTIAGQRFVDLEITFDNAQHNAVEQATLKLNMPDQDEGIYQESASHVLTGNLTVNRSNKLPWQDLTDFSANLGYLSRLESINTTSNCFEVIDNLYDAFQQIWTEEKKRMKWRHDLHHLCQSNIGEPHKDADGRLGLRTTYWTRGHKFFSKPKQEPVTRDKEDLDWSAKFGLESGAPSLSASQIWLSENPLTSTVRAEDIFQDFALDKPSWQQPTSPQPKPDQTQDSMQVDESNADTKQVLDMHFTCELEPAMMLPLSIAQALNERAQVVELQQSHLSNYLQDVLGKIDSLSVLNQRWSKTQYSFSKTGDVEEKQHSYMLYAAGQIFTHPVAQLKFAHPQQYAEALPVLRQYALVNTLLQSIRPDAKSASDRQKPPINSTTTPDGAHKPLPVRPKTGTRSNKPKLDAELNSLLKSTGRTQADEASTLPIDIKIDPISSPTRSCRLEVRIPLSSEIVTRATLQLLKAKRFLAIQIDILLNGIVEIVKLDGVELEKEIGEQLKKRLARVVRACEDIGMVVAWTLKELETS